MTCISTFYGMISPAHTPRELYNEMYNLNYRSEGDMRGFLVRAYHGELQAFTVAIINTDTQELIGWAIVCHDPELDSMDKYHYALNVYVRRTYRRQGYGRKLVEAVESYNKTLVPYVSSPWDDNSTVFFKTVGLPISGL